MPEYKRVRLAESGHEVTVEVVGDGMTELDKPAVDRSGRPLPPKYNRSITSAVEDLKGKRLDEELDKAGLPKHGSAAEKRERLAEHQAATSTAVEPAGDTPEEN